MKGYSKGVNFKTSANKHFAEGGKVSKTPASDFKPGGNREANIKDGFAPNLSKAERDDITARFGAKKGKAVKKALGGIVGKAVSSVQDGSLPKPKGGGILGGIASKMKGSLGTPAGARSSVPRPAPAAGARSVPSHSEKPMFGRGAAMQKAEGGSVCSPAKMKSVASAEVAKHVAGPAPKGHKGL